MLIVEDEAIAARAARVMLERTGCRVTGVVDSGHAAIAAAEEQRPDLVLMDVRLKGSMTGLEAAASIRGLLRIPVIFVSAYASGDLGAGQGDGGAPWLSKPIGEHQLAAAVAQVLGHRELD